MGAWDTGLLDSDDALDALGELTELVQAHLEAERCEPPSARTAARTAAMVAILLQLGSSAFERQPDIVRVAAERQVAHASRSAVGGFLRDIASGRGPQLAAAEGGRSGPMLEALGGYVDHVAPVGVYDDSDAGEYLRSLILECSTRIDEALSGDVDLYETGFAGLVAAVAILLPKSVPAERVERWRTEVSQAAANVDDEGDRSHFVELARRFGIACDIIAIA